MTEELGVSQYPGGFFFFWNVLVPLTVIININKFGIRRHEVGLIIALSLNPSLLQLLTKSLPFSTLVTWFLILTLEGILSRWIWYRIYTMAFLKHTGIFLLSIAVPALLLQIVWNPLNCVLRSFFQNFLDKDVADTLVDAIIMLGASFFLLRVIMNKTSEKTGNCRKKSKEKISFLDGWR